MPESEDDEPIAQYLKALELNPPPEICGKICASLALAYIEKGATGKVVEYAERAFTVGLDPDIEAQLNASLGAVHAAKEEWDDAAEYYEKSIAVSKDDTALALQFAAVRLSQGKEDDAARLCDHVIAVDPENGKAYAMLGGIHYESGRADAALATFEKSIAAGIGDGAIYGALGLLNLKQGNRMEAYKNLYKASHMNCEDAEVYTQLAVFCADQEDQNAELEALTRASELAPADVNAMLRLGKAHFAREDSSSGAALYEKLAEADCSFFEVYAFLAEKRVEAGETDQALIFVLKARALDTKHPAVALLAGQLSLKTGNIEEALPLLESALASNDAADEDRQLEAVARTRLYRDLAYAYEKKGNTEKAVETLKEIVKLDPDNEEIASVLGDARISLCLERSESAHAEDAVSILSDAVASGVEDPRISGRLGLLYLADNENALALAPLKKAAATGSDDSTVYVSLGDLLMEVNDQEAAARSYAEALQLSPDDSQLRSHIAQAYAKADQISKVIEVYSPAEPLSDEDAERGTQLAEVFLAQGKLEYAAALCEAVISSAPKHLPAYYLSAQISLRRERPAEEITALRDVVRLDPEFTAVARETLYAALGAANARLGNFKDAAEACRLAIDADPGKVEVNMVLGSVLACDGQGTEALEAFAAAIEIEKNQDSLVPFLDKSPAHLALGLAFSEGKLPNLAMQRLKHALELDPKNPDIHAAIGDVHSARNEEIAAAAAYARASELGAQDPDLRIGVAKTYAASGRLKDCVAVYKQLDSLSPADVERCTELAESLFSEDKVDAAAALCEVAVLASPEYVPVHHVRALIFERRGALGEQVDALGEIVRLDPEFETAPSEEIYGALGSAWASQGDFSKAATWCRKAIHANAHWAAAWAVLGAVLSSDKDNQEAQDSFEKAIEFDEHPEQLTPLLDKASAHLVLGRAFAARDFADPALRSFKRVVELTPNDPAPHMAIGDMFKDRNEEDAATAAYARAVELGVDEPEKRLRIAQAYAASGRLKECVGVYKRLGSLKPTDAERCTELAEALLDDGKIEEAAELGEMAVKGAPEHVPAHYLLAQVFAHRGAPSQEIDSLRHVIRLDPNFSMVSREKVYGPLASAYAREGDYPEAAIWCRKAIDADVGRAEAQAVLGTVLACAGEDEEAQELFDQALKDLAKPEELRPLIDKAPAHLVLGRAFAARSLGDCALHCFNRAVEIAPKDPLPHAAIGDVYVGRGEDGAAGASYARAVELGIDDPNLRIRVARAYGASGRMEDCISVYKTLKTVGPDDAKLCTALADEFLADGKLEPAAALAELTASGLPEYVPTQYLLSRIFAKRDSPDQEITALRQVIRLDPEFSVVAKEDVYAALGSAYSRQGKFREACEWCRKAIDADPDKAEVWAVLGAVLACAGEVDQAFNAFGKALELSDQPERLTPPLDRAAAQFSLGRAFAGRAWLDPALARFQRAAELAPKDSAPHAAIGDIYAGRNEEDSAAAAYIRASELGTEDHAVHSRVADYYLKKKDFKKAEELLIALSEMVPEDRTVLRHLGQVHLLSREPGKAAAAYKRALKLDPADADTSVLLVDALLAAGEASAALEEAERALTLGPEMKAAVALRAVVWQSWNGQGRYNQVITECRKVLRDNPDHINANSAISAAYAGTQDWERTVYHCNHILDLNPEHAEAMGRLGVAYFHQKFYNMAIKALDSFVAKAPEDAKGFYYLGLAQENHDESEAAIAAWRRAVTLDPNGETGERAQKKIRALEKAQ